MKTIYSNTFKYFIYCAGIFIVLFFSNVNAQVIINDNMKKSNIANEDSKWQDALPALGLPSSDIIQNKNEVKTILSNDFLTKFGFSAWIVPKDKYTLQTAVAKDEVLVLDTIVSYELTGAENNVYGELATSIRNGTGGMIMVNLATGQTNCFFFSNEGIYMFNDSIGARKYNSVKRVSNYTPNEVVSLKQEYDRKNNELRWYLNGKLVGTIPSEKIGFPGFANYNGLAPHPITNPGKTQSELMSALSTNFTDLLGIWYVGPFLGTATADLNLDGTGEGLIPIDEFSGASYIFPTSFKVTLQTASSNINLYYKNITVNNPSGKSIAMKVYKFKMSVRKAD